MQRRKFLKLAGLGTAAVALPTAAYTARSFEGVVAGILQRELHYLDLDPAGVTRFAAEYFADATAETQVKVRLLHVLRSGADDSWLVGDMVKQYLMGSDFFRTGMDEARLVRFDGLYSPYRRPCQHPFSAAYYPDAGVSA